MYTRVDTEKREYVKYFVNYITIIFCNSLMIIQYCTERGLTLVDTWIQIKKRDGENRTVQQVSRTSYTCMLIQYT